MDKRDHSILLSSTRSQDSHSLLGLIMGTGIYFQHWIWRLELGFLLNPETSVKQGTKIADVACCNRHFSWLKLI